MAEPIQELEQERTFGPTSRPSIWTLLMSLAASAVVPLVVMGCGDDDDGGGNIPDGNSVATATATSEATSGGGGSTDGGGDGSPGGQISVGDMTWTFEADLQCSVFPGPVVAIAANVADEPGTVVTLDYEGEDDAGARVASSVPGGPNWSAVNESVSFEIDGDSISGEGTFTEQGSGQQQHGTFEVNC